MITNQKGLALIKQFEGLRVKAYKCPGGIWTIGYGHTSGVRPEDTITESQAEQFLIQDIKEVELTLKYLLTGALVNENQWSALVSLVFNIGLGAFSRSTLRKLLPYSKTRAADEFLNWNKAGGKTMAGLLKRRKAERALFLEIPTN